MQKAGWVGRSMHKRLGGRKEYAKKAGGGGKSMSKRLGRRKEYAKKAGGKEHAKKA